MGALTIQPLSVLQETVNENPAQQSAPSVPSPDSNLAQSGGAPQDTVILTGKGAETQLSGGGSGGSQSQQAALFFATQNIFLDQGSQDENRSPQQVQAPPIPNQAKTPGAPQQAAASGPGDSSSNGSSATPQQQLATLDQTLQRLGINPQSISLFNRMELLLYASDPAALRVLVQGLQGGAQQQGSAASSAANQTQAAEQLQSTVQTSGASAQDSASTQFAQFAQQTVQPQQTSQQSGLEVPAVNGAPGSAITQGQGINITV
jgi:hypothetical protein